MMQILSNFTVSAKHSSIHIQMMYVLFQLITKFSLIKPTPFEHAVPYSTLCLWRHRDRATANTIQRTGLNLFLTTTKLSCGTLPVRPQCMLLQIPC